MARILFEVSGFMFLIFSKKQRKECRLQWMRLLCRFAPRSDKFVVQRSSFVFREVDHIMHIISREMKQ